MVDNLFVEYKCSINGAYYKGSVIDIYDDGVLIQFEDGLGKSKFSRVRLPPIEHLPVNVGTLGIEVEIFSLSKVNEKYGWWCVVVKMRGEVLDVECNGWETGFKETVGLEQIRHKNPNPPINIETFSKYELAVPIELRELCKLNGVHQHFQQAVRAGVCNFEANRGVLCFISKHRASKGVAEDLQLMHYHYLREKLKNAVIEVHGFSLYFAWNLTTAWRSRTATRRKSQ